MPAPRPDRHQTEATHYSSRDCAEALLWDQFAVLLPEYVDTHLLGCRNPHGRIVFEYVIGALVHGSGHEGIAGATHSDRKIRRRAKHWAQPGMPQIKVICRDRDPFYAEGAALGAPQARAVASSGIA